jgi:hypothetical protein
MKLTMHLQFAAERTPLTGDHQPVFQLKNESGTMIKDDFNQKASKIQYIIPLKFLVFKK